MALKIRLARGGSTHDAHYKIVVIENTKSRDGQATDIIGHYHPNVHNENRIVIDAEKLNKWISNGAKPTETVARLGISQGFKVLEKFVPKHGESKNKGKTKKEVKAEKSAK